MRGSFGLAVLLGVQGFAPHPALSQGEKDKHLDAVRDAIFAFQAKDQKLQNVGWRLALGNAPFCTELSPSVGLQLHDVTSYSEPGAVRAALGLKRDFAVQSAARNSPAFISGAFTQNREVVRLDKTDPNQWEGGKRLDWSRTGRTRDWIEQYLRTHQSITVRFETGPAVTVEPEDICAVRFDLIADEKFAKGGKGQVAIGSRFPGFAYSEPVFAGVVAHEMAHNVLGHSQWLDRNKRKRKNIRLIEKEADRLMPWLMANAGYDPKAAVTFMETWGPKHGGGLFRKRTHDGWDERAEFIAAELPIIARLMKDEGRADWTKHFRREINPDVGA